MSVCSSVWLPGVLWKNGWLDLDVVWCGGSAGSSDKANRWRWWLPHGKGQFWGGRKAGTLSRRYATSTPQCHILPILTLRCPIPKIGDPHSQRYKNYSPAHPTHRSKGHNRYTELLLLLFTYDKFPIVTMGNLLRSCVKVREAIELPFEVMMSMVGPGLVY